MRSKSGKVEQMVKIKKFVCLLFGCLICFSLLLNAGCAKGGKNETEEEGVQWTDHMLVQDGKTDYVILLAADATDADKLCASELNTFYAEATGSALSVVTEGEQSGSVEKYISIGKTQKAAENNVSADYAELGVCGYIVKTVDDDVYILGDDPGVVYGAYEFLEKEFGYHYYSDGIYHIDTNVTKCNLASFDVKEIPDIEYRQTSYGFEKSPSDSMYPYRMRLNDMSPEGVGGMAWHNFMEAIPKSEHQAAHPEWYSSDGTNLCLTRDLDGLAEEMKNVVVEMLEEDPTLKFIHIGQPDTRTWCNCEKCTEVIENHGGFKVSTYILFMNKVADLLQPYLDENGLDVKLTFFAYHATDTAPIVEDTENGGYKVVSDDLYLRDNVYVLFAPIDADYFVSFNDEENTLYRKNLIGWSTISKRVLIWIYSENFSHYLTPFDNFNSMQTNFQMLTEHGVFWCYNQAQWDNGNSTGFSHLKAYLSANLQWDAYQDLNALIDEFFEGYYGDAAPAMREIFDGYRTWRSYCFYELDLNGSVYTETNASHWPYALLKSWLDKADEAFAAIEKYRQTDIDTYNRLYDAVNLETLTFRYQMITFNSMYYSASELTEMKKSFKDDAIALGLTRSMEKKDISELWTDWGIA